MACVACMACVALRPKPTRAPSRVRPQMQRHLWRARVQMQGCAPRCRARATCRQSARAPRPHTRYGRSLATAALSCWRAALP
eukprot:4279915-Pleurochrysis_carterae.AAC.1